MSQTGIVTPDDGLRVRNGPGTDHSIIGILTKDEEVTLIEKVDDWWAVDSRFGLGFVHSDFVRVEEETEPTKPTEPVDPAKESSYVCVEGDTLFGICTRFGLDPDAVASLNGLFPPFLIRIGQTLRLPGAPAPVVTTTISILNPLSASGDTLVTSSSLQGHHTPYLGACSCDVDILGGFSPGTPVRFNIGAPEGVEARGLVDSIGLACASQLITDGGRTVKLIIQTRPAGGAWSNSGAWVLYAHMDPVSVGPGDVVEVGTPVGVMGPPGGGEYASSCAGGSHVHVEAAGARCIVNQNTIVRGDPVMTVNA